MSTDRDFVAPTPSDVFWINTFGINTQNVKRQMTPEITFVLIIRQDVLEQYFLVMLTNLLALVCFLPM
jgi:hypothetical protein